MNLLFVTQKAVDGREKVYRFDADRKRIIIGHSRKADIRLPKALCENFEGCIEFENGGWVYHSFSMSDKAPIIVQLSKGGKFRIGEYLFSTDMVEQKALFDEAAIEGDLGEQIVLVNFHGQLFHTARIATGQTLKLELAGETMNIVTRQSRTWLTEVHGSFEVRQRTLMQQSKTPFLKSFSENFDLSRTDRFVLGGILLTVLLGIVSVSMRPSAPVEVAIDEIPKSSQPLVMKLVPPTERRAPQEPGQKSADGKTANRIQNLSQSIANRASQFMKKASRMPASIGPNGSMNAPAMGVANLDGPKTDWNMAAGQKVSGQVGGTLSGTGSASRLSGNGVGSSGVNLLEQESEISGGLDREVIAEFIRRHIGHILYCYERSLSANPNLFGKVSVRFVIGSSGKVETQKIGESTLRDNRVEGCILEKVSQWKFPTPKGGVQVSVSYPFLFKTTN